MSHIQRNPPIEAFTTMQKLVMAMVARQMTYDEIAERLHVKRNTSKAHAHAAARRIPGDLPAITKIHFWYRGATLDQLTGEGWLPKG